MNLASARPPVPPGMNFLTLKHMESRCRSQPQWQPSQQLSPAALTIAGTPASAAVLPKVKPAKGVRLHAPANCRALVSPAKCRTHRGTSYGSCRLLFGDCFSFISVSVIKKIYSNLKCDGLN